MKNKILFGINLFFMLCILASMFLPFDSMYIYALDLAIGILVFILLFIEMLIKREKLFLLPLFLQLMSFALFYIFVNDAVRYELHKIGWKINQCLMLFPIIFATFICSRQVFKQKRLLVISFIFLQLFIFTKALFFTQFYEFNSNNEKPDDIRDFPNWKQYKITGMHTLKNKKPVSLTDEDYVALEYFLNKSDWLKENYPGCSADIPSPVDRTFIRQNIKYSFSLLQYCQFKKLDVYRLSLPAHGENLEIHIYIPKGEYYFYGDDDKNEFQNCYGFSLPDADTYVMYDGLAVPITEEWYESNINNW